MHFLETLWLLLLLLLQLSLRLFNCATIDCSAGNNTVRLNSSHILRTWHPNADCQRWVNRTHSKNRYSGSHRYGPSLLVMELRQPMLLDRTSIRNSVLTASSLPMDWQLPNPCEAAWEDFFGDSARRNQLRDNSNEVSKAPDSPINQVAAVSFILLNSSQPLDAHSIELSGRIAPIRFADYSHRMNLNCVPTAWRGGLIRFSINSCGSQPPKCRVQMADESWHTASQATSGQSLHEPVIMDFIFEYVGTQAPKLLVCTYGDSAATITIERAIGFDRNASICSQQFKEYFAHLIAAFASVLLAIILTAIVSSVITWRRVRSRLRPPRGLFRASLFHRDQQQQSLRPATSAGGTDSGAYEVIESLGQPASEIYIDRSQLDAMSSVYMILPRRH